MASVVEGNPEKEEVMASVVEGNTGKEEVKLRVFFIPFFVSSHMISMLDLARLFATRQGVEPTMVVTQANADLIRPTIDRSIAAGRPVRILLYPFPSEAGLPPGVENLTTASSADEWRIYKAVELVRVTHDRILRDHRPDAVVADIPYWWTTTTAAEIGIPRITFHCVGAFPQCVMNILERLRPHDRVTGENVPFTVPDLPGPPIELVRSELPEFLQSADHPVTKEWAAIHKGQLESYGVVSNTFYELEPEFCDLYRQTACRQAWFVGPVADGAGDAAVRGGGSAESRDRCMAWLDAHPPRSVVFVCLGSWFDCSPEQLQEMAAGLEASRQPFLWVVRGWAPEVGERGMVVRGWAPQVEILNHASVGAFMTHCGWNSLLEATAAGMPMLTWPLKFEQFINERLVVGAMGAGVRVWNGFRSTEETETVVVPGEMIGRVVAGFMSGPVEEARRRVQEYKLMAKAAWREGGTSRRDLNRLIDELMEMTLK